MKRTALLVTLTATLLSGVPQAQVVRTYLEETFQGPLSETNWDFDNSIPVRIEAGTPEYLHMLQDRTGNNRGGWAYDTTGMIAGERYDQALEGTYILASRYFDMEPDAVNVVSLDLLYKGTPSNNPQKRIFGIQARRGRNGTWKTLDSLQSMSNEMEKRLYVTLGEEFSGKDSVQIAFFFRNKHNPASPFLCLMDDIRFEARKNLPAISAKIIRPHFLAEENVSDIALDFRLFLSNSGVTDISSAEYAYVAGNRSLTRGFTLSFKKLSAFTGNAYAHASIRFTDGIFGKNTLKMWPVKINGKDFAASEKDTTTHELVFIDPSRLDADFVPMMEYFSSATCGSCAGTGKELNPVLDELKAEGKINVVKYQMYFPNEGDKYFIAPNVERMAFYDTLLEWKGWWSVPAPVFNAECSLEKTASRPAAMADSLRVRTEAAHARKALMEIEVKKAGLDVATGKLDFEIRILPALTMQANVLVFITEKTTTGNKAGNGETEFHSVNMAAPLGGNGKPFDFKADSAITITGSVDDMHATHMEEPDDLEIVCFVQSGLDQGGVVFQSASAAVNATALAVEDEEDMRLEMYPNPATDHVTLLGLRNAHVSVHDLTGRTIHEIKHAEGTLEIRLASFPAGIYTVRIRQEGKIACKKLAVGK